MNAYITPESARGFEPHYDVHDVFVLQVSGEKHWSVHAPVREHPGRMSRGRSDGRRSSRAL